jgi:hypothetical protein
VIAIANATNLLQVTPKALMTRAKFIKLTLLVILGLGIVLAALFWYEWHRPMCIDVSDDTQFTEMPLEACKK